MNAVYVSMDVLRGIGVPESACAKMRDMGLILSMTAISGNTVKFGLDSGVVVTIIPTGEAADYPTEDVNSGIIYKNASGGAVPDQGLRRLIGRNADGRRFGVKARVGPVARPLMAVCELCDAGQEVTFRKHDAIIKKHGRTVMKIPRVGKLWQLTMNIEAPPGPNGRQAHP